MAKKQVNWKGFIKISHAQRVSSIGFQYLKYDNFKLKKSFSLTYLVFFPIEYMINNLWVSLHCYPQNVSNDGVRNVFEVRAGGKNR